MVCKIIWLGYMDFLKFIYLYCKFQIRIALSFTVLYNILLLIDLAFFNEHNYFITIFKYNIMKSKIIKPKLESSYNSLLTPLASDNLREVFDYFFHFLKFLFFLILEWNFQKLSSVYPRCEERTGSWKAGLNFKSFFIYFVVFQ